MHRELAGPRQSFEFGEASPGGRAATASPGCPAWCPTGRRRLAAAGVAAVAAVIVVVVIIAACKGGGKTAPPPSPDRKPAPPPPPSPPSPEDPFRIGDRVTVMTKDDASKEERANGTIAQTVPALMVAIDGKDIIKQYTDVQHLEEKGFEVGNRVRVTGSRGKDWATGTVTQAVPLYVAADTDDEPGGRLYKHVEHIADEGFKVGDRVRVKHHKNDKFRHGTVTHAVPLFVAADGLGDTGVFYPIVERLNEDPFEVGDKVEVVVKAGGGKKTGRVTKAVPLYVAVDDERNSGGRLYQDVTHDERGPRGFKVGDKVKVKNKDMKDWANGIVAEAWPLYVVTDNDPYDNSRGSLYDEVEHLEERGFAVGDRVRIKDQHTEANGTVTQAVPLHVIQDGQVNAKDNVLQIEHIEEEGFEPGERVRVKAKETDPWAGGTVKQAVPLYVAKDGQSDPWGLYAHVVHADEARIEVDDRVEVKVKEADKWAAGTVVQAVPLYVAVDGHSTQWGLYPHVRRTAKKSPATLV
uniref:Uncharacterized protein n=1 Tax=Zooxanthella nutricula TaxID=1333877 RepID=A0A6U6NZE7_9DINO